MSSVFSRPPCSWNFSIGIIASLRRSALRRIDRGYRTRPLPLERARWPTTLPDEMSDLSFTHLDPLGRARMVDVTPKEPTHRRAVARCKVFMQPATTAAIANREVNKGDVLAVARVAG